MTIKKVPGVFAIQAQVSPTKNGQHRILVTLEDGHELAVTLPAELSASFLRDMQNSLLAENSEEPAHMMSPIPLQVENSTLGHGVPGSGIMVETDRMGWIALFGSIEKLRELHKEVGRAIDAMEARKAGSH